MNESHTNAQRRGRADGQSSVPIGGARKSPASRKPMDPLTALHSDFKQVLGVIKARIDQGVSAVNAPLPATMSLEIPGKQSKPLDFPSRQRRPFDLFVDYLGKPGSVVARRNDFDIDLLIAKSDPTRLAVPALRLFYKPAADTLGEFCNGRQRPGAGPESLREVLRDIGTYLIAGASKDIEYAQRWRKALEEVGVDQYKFLTTAVARRIVDGTVETGAACGDMSWSLETGHALLSTVVDAIGEGACEDFVDDLRARCKLALERDARRGEFETVNGDLLVSIMGLARFRALNPHDPESIARVFDNASERFAGDLRAWCWLWTGSEDDAERPAPQRLADIALRDIGWVRPWSGKARGDALFESLRKNPNAFPRRLGNSAVVPALTTVAPNAESASAPIDAVEPLAEDDDTPAAAPAADDGSSNGFQILALDDIYRFRPVTVVLLGMSGVGKSTFIRALFHHLMERRSEVFTGADALVLADRCSETIRDGFKKWCARKTSSPTAEAVLEYHLEIPRLMTIRLIDHRGELLGLVDRECSAIAVSPGGDQAEASHVLTETMATADGIIAFLSCESLVEEARDGGVDPERRVPEVDVLADRLGRVLSGRRSDHVPVALVMNKLDSIVSGEDFDMMYELGSVIGNGPSGGHLPRLRSSELTEWAVRQPIATGSLAAQSVIMRLIAVLNPICAQLEAFTRRVGLFVTSALPVMCRDLTLSSRGPVAIVSWILEENLIPAFLSQAQAQIALDRETVAAAKKDYSVVQRIVKLVAVDPRAGAVIAALPGMNKVAKKLRDRRIVALNETLRRYGTEVSTVPSNVELFAARDHLEARINYSTEEIDAMEKRVEDFAARFGSD